MQKSVCLKYGPASEPLHVSVEQFSLKCDLFRSGAALDSITQVVTFLHLGAQGAVAHDLDEQLDHYSQA